MAWLLYMVGAVTSERAYVLEDMAAAQIRRRHKCPTVAQVRRAAQRDA